MASKVSQIISVMKTYKLVCMFSSRQNMNEDAKINHLLNILAMEKLVFMFSLLRLFDDFLTLQLTIHN